MLRLSFVLVLMASASASSAPSKPASKKVEAPAVVKGPSDRIITITDATTAAEVRLAPPGQTTTLTFPADVDAPKAVVADPQMRILPPIIQGATVVLTSTKPLPAGTTVPLALTLVDGTQLNFAVGPSLDGASDRFVRVEVQMQQRAGADSASRLKGQVAELQAKLDDCSAGASEAGIAKLAAIILKQDLTKPDTFTVEARRFKSGIDKQNRLLVETQHVFRLFDLTYLALTIENRDPTQPWVLERAELAVQGSGNSSDIKVLGVEQELNAIPSGATSKAVISFRMPTLNEGQRFELRLFEKNGARHFKLGDLKL
jgi:hypothetical protein